MSSSSSSKDSAPAGRTGRSSSSSSYSSETSWTGNTSLNKTATTTATSGDLEGGRKQVLPPYSAVGVISRAFFWFAFAMVRAARRLAKAGQTLTWDDLYFDEEYTADRVADRMTKAWEAEGDNPSALHALTVGFAGKAWLFKVSFIYFVRCVFHLSEVVFFFLVLRTYYDAHAELYGTFLYAIGVWLAAVIFVVMDHLLVWNIQKMQVKATAGLRAMVYRKALRLSDNNGLGAWVSTISSEVDSVVGFLNTVFPLLGGVFEAIGAFIMLYFFVSWFLFVSLGIMIVVLIILQVNANALTRRSATKGALGGQRANLIGEMLAIIRAIKFYAWEKNFFETVAAARKKESDAQHRVERLKNINFMLMIGVPGFLAVGALIPYAATGILSLTNALPALVLLEFLRFAMWTFPAQISQLLDARASAVRLGLYMALPEVVPKDLADRKIEKGSLHLKKGSFAFPALPASAATTKSDAATTATGTDKSTSATTSEGKKLQASTSSGSDLGKRKVLHDLSLLIKPGSLVGVVGEVGSGKTALALSILGEMEHVGGESRVHGPRVAFVPQEAFIMNATVKQNILFGLPFDEERYARAVEASALISDFKELANGDETPVGDRGLTVSGGQKQRISLARAVYSQADIFVLDDPLSAVDAHVGLYIFNQLIKGALEGKTIVFITNQTQYLSQCDSCVALLHGRIAFSGEPTDVIRSLGLEGHQRSTAPDAHAKPVEKFDAAALRKETAAQPEKEMMWGPPRGLIATLGWAMGGVLGAIWATITTLFIMGGFLLSYLALLGYTNKLGIMGVDDFHIFVALFMAFIVFYTLIGYIRSLTNSLFVAKQLDRLHDSLLWRVLRTPMRFFEVTPAGDILGWFGTQFVILDAAGPVAIEIGFGLYFFIGFFVIVMALLYPYLLLSMIPILGFYLFMIWFYKPVYTQLKMLQGMASQPISSHYGETLRGLSSIRAYQAQDIFRLQNEAKLNQDSAATFSFNAAERWMTLVSNFVGSMVVLEAAILVAVQRKDAPVSTDGTLSFDSARASLALFFGFSVFAMSTLFVNFQVLFQSLLGMLGFLRAVSSTLPQEKDAVVEGEKIPDGWPSAGKIEFKKLEMRYRPELPPVLKQITLTIRPGEKVGVVGRTGAGKSSMTAALFRLVEAHSGKILIDGVEISKIGLDTLRHHLTIVTQDSAMFLGTVRYNLDPFNQYTDKEIEKAIRIAGLDDVVAGLSGGLQAPVTERGGNFSAGQKQQVSLARALLRKPRILVLDEATSSVDHDTDRKLQDALRAASDGVTVVTIAHRLNTIMDYDRVLVLDKGNVAEFDTPAALLSREDSIFKGMVNATGERMSEKLHRMADRAERKRNGESVSASSSDDEAQTPVAGSGSGSGSGSRSGAAYTYSAASASSKSS